MDKRKAPQNEEEGRTTGLAAQALGQGQQEAFTGLYEQVAPRLLAWARVRSRQGPGAGALSPEDLMQEVWLRALPAYPRFDRAKAPFFGWLLGIARNVLLESYRSSSRGPKAPSAADAPIEAAPEAVTSLTQRLSRDDTLRALDEHLQELPREDREVLVRCAIEGEPVRQVAERLGLSEEATFKRWQRLRRRLREAGWLQALLVEA